MIRVLITLASVATPVADKLPQFSTDPIPQALYQEFRDQIILQGRCLAYEAAESHEEKNQALDACFLDFIAPKT